MNKYNNKLTGKLGEDLAAEYLKKEGYTLLARNWGNKWGEIDLVVRNTSGVIVFVEVKTKIGIYFGRPEQMVNYRKLQQIRRIASLFPAGIDTVKRIDVIAIVLSRALKVEKLNHYQGVY